MSFFSAADSAGHDRFRIRPLIALAAALLVASCSTHDDAQGARAAPAPDAPLSVATKRVERQSVPIVLEAVGQAEGSREVEIRPRVAGILEKRLYSEGAPVKAGQTLFTIGRAPFELAVTQAKASLSQERARQELAQHEAERLRSLADTKAISRREYDQAVSTLKESAAAIEGAQAKLAEAQLNLSYTNLKAPIGGITSRAVRSEGSLLAANTDLLTTITQVDPIWVRFSVAESDFDRIRNGAASAHVSISDSNGSAQARDGRLNFTGSTVDPKLGTVQLRAEFPNADLTWLPGQFVKVRIVAGSQDAFLVPQSAVVQTEQARFVWLVGSDGKAVQRQVQTTNWLGSDWIITAGLSPGDVVIVDSLMKLKPGTSVTPRTGDAAKQADASPVQPPPR
ncbi:MAG TPA: efflux RND transporter periplasmic adaptor subunit [Casimicrobiaceae bacterium]|nr:efflux RND transporter periplasmic adaptor subunit [Casimicrobiaceae bacterium]